MKTSCGHRAAIPETATGSSASSVALSSRRRNSTASCGSHAAVCSASFASSCSRVSDTSFGTLGKNVVRVLPSAILRFAVHLLVLFSFPCSFFDSFFALK